MTKPIVALVAGAAGLTAGYFIGDSTPGSSTSGDVGVDQRTTLQIGTQAVREEERRLAASGETADHSEKLVSRKRGVALIDAIWVALDNPDELAREQAFKNLIADMHPNDALAVRGVFLDGDKQGRWFIPEWAHFWSKWGEVDGAAAAQYLLDEDDDDDPGYRVGAGHVMRDWVKTDLEGAKAWIAEIDYGESVFSEELVRAFATAYVQSNRDTALDYVATLDDPDLKETSIEALVSGISQAEGIDGFEKWVRTLPEGEIRKTVATRMGSVYRKMGENNSREWIAAYADDPNRDDVMIEAFANTRWRRRPGASLEFLASLPPSPHDGSQPGVAKAASLVARFNPERLDTWLSENTTHPAADTILADFAETSAKSNDLAAAVDRASRIRDPELQAKVLKNLEDYVPQ